METCTKATVRVTMEAAIDVDVYYTGNLTTEQVFNLAHKKALLSDVEEFSIKDEISCNITNTQTNVQGEPMNSLLDELFTNEEEGDEIDMEDSEDDMEDDIAINEDGMGAPHEENVHNLGMNMVNL